MRKVKVLIVEDSHTQRILLREIVGSDERLQIVGEAGSAEEALLALPQLQPDVISLDIRLPGMNGFEFTRVVMQERPTPIVVVSASVDAEDLNISMNALRFGALSVVEKPVSPDHPLFERQAAQIRRHLRIMSEVKVLRRWSGTASGPDNEGPTVLPAPQCERSLKILAVAASTGGPNALVTLLTSLGDGFGLPIVLVQHIAPGFTQGFARWLGSITPFQVEVASDGQALRPGLVLMAPPDRHLKVSEGRVALDGSWPIDGHRPSATVLFESVAAVYAERAIGVLLTGMGVDGARGLFSMRRRGALTLCEDRSTAVVYGMPAEASRLRAASVELPLPSIGPYIRRSMQRSGVDV
jgi:two-component system, chemotaxis family, protein-glutamate methylesterase/glutaminase